MGTIQGKWWPIKKLWGYTTAIVFTFLPTRQASRWDVGWLKAGKLRQYLETSLLFAGISAASYSRQIITSRQVSRSANGFFFSKEETLRAIVGSYKKKIEPFI